MVEPVFIFSLPRSGSTMLQRELASHPEIATVSEPWFLLGLLLPASDDLAGATYNYNTYRMGLEDLVAALPAGEEDWNDAMRGAAQKIYDKLAAAHGGKPRYFLDKTPRYSLAPAEIRKIFPEAPVIVVWRNPLAVAASMMSTYSAGRWNLYRFVQDFEIALPRLVEFAMSDPEDTVFVRYEDIVGGDGSQLAEIYSFLSLENDDCGDETGDRREAVQFQGRLGDPTGGLNREAAALGDDRWKVQFCNPLRRFWARRYLKRLGKERLGVMGYELNVLERQLAACAGWAPHLISDTVLMTRGVCRRMFLTSMISLQWRRMRGGQPMVDLE
ncbi:sulfotransferase [Martelella alba]|uniref:Sulfotransferase n=1 Tax=Martelella alba TaxID=2590451 RepID=A0A506U014_9HYPH|nr:sulfotransferase [Martelella alba]TPW27110.1 sulfotransferase [Martelella alba]